MKAVGIIAEYNPFHKGHEYHLKESLQMSGADCAVCVMSGNILQRGEPALTDKWIRAEMAVRSGVDLVLELPYGFAVNSARYFAMGGVMLLNRLGCVSHLSFGSESGNLQQLEEAAELLSDEEEPPALSEQIQKGLAQGLAYPRARQLAIQTLYGGELAQLLTAPNNILGVEYLKQIKAAGSAITPITVRRKGADYLEKSLPKQGFASAKSIRETLEHWGLSTGLPKEVREQLPEGTIDILENLKLVDFHRLEDFYPMIASRILCDSTDLLGQALSVTEGLEYRMKKAVIQATDMNSLVKAIKSKRYSETRIRRMLFHVLTGFGKEEFQHILDQGILYGRVLGFSPKGAKLLKQIKEKEQSSIPILTNINRQTFPQDPINCLLKWDVLMSELYHLSGEGEIYSRSDRVVSPFVLKESEGVGL